MATVVHNYDTAGNYTIGAGLRVFNSYASLTGHQDSSATPVLTTNNGADDGGAGEFDQCLDFVTANTDYLLVSDATYIPSKLVIEDDTDFTIEFWMRLNGTPSVVQLPFDIRRVGSWNSVTGIELQTTSGVVRCMLRGLNSVGWTQIYGGTDVCDNAWHHIAYIRDTGNDEIRLYVDGTSDATPVTDATTGDISSSANCRMVLGVYAYNLTQFPYDGDIDEVRVSNSIRYTSNFTPSTSEFVADANTLYLNHCENATAHSTSDPAIYKTTGDNINVGSWTSFVEDATKYDTGTAEIKYQLYNGSAYQYWNGSAWANSNGTYAQSNDDATVNTNIGTFTTGSITGFNIKSLLHADASDTPILDSVTATYVEPSTGVKDFMRFW